MGALSINPQLIIQLFFWGTFIACVLLYLTYSGSNSCHKLLDKKSPVPALLLTIVWIVLIGLRPVWAGFGDTVNYAYGYSTTLPIYSTIDFHSEWLFSLFTVWCRSMGFTVNVFFLLIEIGYLGFMYWAYKKALWENVWFAMLFALSAYSVFTYGVNGLRNGLACSMVTLAVVFAAKDRNFVVAGLLCFLAMGIHKSTILPIAALIAATFLIKKLKTALLFWLASFFLSLWAGGTISNIFLGLGFDDRADAYMSGEYYKENTFSSTGFRWNFLLYSTMPVLLIWHIQRKIEQRHKEIGGQSQEEEESGVYGAGIMADAVSMRVFNTIAIVYLLSNAFWIIVIRAAFSNRFAYLSWFIYPLVLAYAVIRLHIWKDQDRKAALILLAHAGFTILMYVLGKV